jgi:hypothetical protein
MKIENIDTVIAERELEGQDNGKPCKVVVRFGKPIFDQSGDGGWRSLRFWSRLWSLNRSCKVHTTP